MQMIVTIDGNDYEIQITARRIINKEHLYARLLMSESETRELLFEAGLFGEFEKD